MTDDSKLPLDDADDEAADARALRALFRAARAEPEPPRAIDERITAAAKAAADRRARGQAVRARRAYGGWGLAMAAGLALCVVLLRPPEVAVPGSDYLRDTPELKQPSSAQPLERRSEAARSELALPIAPTAVRSADEQVDPLPISASPQPSLAAESLTPTPPAVRTDDLTTTDLRRDAPRQTVDMPDAGGFAAPPMEPPAASPVDARTRAEARTQDAASMKSAIGQRNPGGLLGGAAERETGNVTAASAPAAPAAVVQVRDAAEQELAALLRMHAARDAQLLPRLRAFRTRYPDFPLLLRAPELAALLPH